MPKLWNNTPKVIVSREEVARFNTRWPGSKLRPTRTYYFEFDPQGDLVDTDMPWEDDGPEAIAMAEDCKKWLEGDIAEWMEAA